MQEDNPFNFFEKIFIINLDYRTDRLKTIMSELERLGISKDRIERFSAIRPDAKQIPQQWYQHLVSPQAVEITGKNEKGQMIGRLNLKYLSGSIGCKLSHKAIIERAKQRGYKNFLVLEDDCVFNTNATLVLESLKSALNHLSSRNIRWHMLYLSGNHLNPTFETSCPNLQRMSGSLTTHAYAMNSTAYDIALDGMMESGMEIDNYYIGKIQSLEKCFTVKPNIVEQSVGFSDVLSRDVNYTGIIT